MRAIFTYSSKGSSELFLPIQVRDHERYLVDDERLLVLFLNVLDLLVDPGEVGDPDLGLGGADLEPLEHDLVFFNERHRIRFQLWEQSPRT
jgi:hypothetical protein